ncbi:uncharacterized protein [Littorina saxatilis]|uniref:uncharacterized protein isoform X2 n=1 Tax=Littorina saxatilis TaxID=31220 RepID=UPI0038B43C49
MLSVARKTVRFREPGEGSAGQSQEVVRRREEEGQQKAPTSTTTTPPASTPSSKSREATASSQGRTTLSSSESTALADVEAESEPQRTSSVTFSGVAFSRTQSQADLEKEKPEGSPGAELQEKSDPEPEKPQEDLLDELNPENSSYFVDTRNYLTRQGIVLKPKNPFSNKVITVYALSPRGKTPPEKTSRKNCQIVHVETADLAKRTASRQAYVVVDKANKKVESWPSDAPSEIVYLKLEPGCQKYIVPLTSVTDSAQEKSRGSSSVGRTLPLVAAANPTSTTRTSPITSRPATVVGHKRPTVDNTVSFSSTNNSAVSVANKCPATAPKLDAKLISTTATTTTMSTYPPGMDIYTPVSTATLSRTQEKVELQHLNDRFAAYVQRVRTLAEKNNHMDSTALIKSTKVLEIEIHNLKNMYEQELDKLRKELEVCNHDRTTQQVQVQKQLQYSSELQDRLNVETDKISKLMDESNDYRRRIGLLEGELKDLGIASSRPLQEMEQLLRKIDNLTRENETWKHRYESEEVARLEDENKIQQLVKKMEFDDKVNAERVAELQARIESSAALILSLEAKVRDLSRTDMSVSELLKQVRDSADTELRKFQYESDDQYNRNLTALKAQMDNDAKTIEQLETERTQLRGSVGELQARIRSLEGQVANLDHQKQTLEDAIAVERNRAADSARSLEHKLREVQEMLVVKMREVTSAREQNIPLKSEIEALKALMEEEEKRLKLILMTTSPTNTPPTSTPSTTLPPLPPATGSTRPPSSPRLTVPLAVTTTTSVPVTRTTSTSLDRASFNHSYNLAPATPANSAMCQVDAHRQQQQHLQAMANAYSALPLTSTAQAVPHTDTSLSSAHCVTFTPETRPYDPSPPLSVTYIPEALQTPGYEPAFGMLPPHQYDDEFDPQLFGYTGSVPFAKYSYETTPAVNRLALEPYPPDTPRQAAKARAKSAPVGREQDLNLVSADIGQGHDYFDQMFYDLQRDTLYRKGRPQSSPQKGGRQTSSLYDDYTVSTSSATGDLKIFEVQQDGKYVRLLNDGVQEVEFGGFMLQQNVGGHPVAVFRFPPRTKFAPNSTITVYAGCNDHKLHNPPTEFIWKEQQKWGTGPECTTILCRPNGQAIAWTTAAHRFTRDPFQEVQSEPDDHATTADDERHMDDVCGDDESLTEINVNVNAPKPVPVYLRREKQQPPSLQANKHPHGNPPSTPVHPVGNQPRPYRSGNDNSSNNRQSRSQSTRPDPIPGQPYAGAAAQKMGSAPLRKYVSGVSTQQQSGIRTTGKAQDDHPGEVTEVPSPFMKPHARFQSGLDQVQSQHHHEFLPAMPRPPLCPTTW